MIIKTLYLIPFFLIMAVPYFYKSKLRLMRKFEETMAWKESARRLFTLGVFLFLIAIHAMHLWLIGNHYLVLVSTLLLYGFLSHKFFEKVVYSLQYRRILIAAMTLALACLLSPFTFTLGVIFGVMGMAALFYPSRLSLRESEKEKRIMKYYTWSAC